MARKFDIRAHTQHLNLIRLSLLDNSFSSAILRNHFKVSGIPSNILFWTVFSNSGILKRLGKDSYCFDSPKTPIYFRTFAEIYNNYKVRVDSYNARYKNRKSRKRLLKRTDIQAAIKLLKAHGMDVIISVDKI